MQHADALCMDWLRQQHLVYGVPLARCHCQHVRQQSGLSVFLPPPCRVSQKPFSKARPANLPMYGLPRM